MDNKKYNGMISLRLKPELHKRIVQAADKKQRSLNQFISIILERSLDEMDKNDNSNNFENRQFIGQIVDTSKVNLKSGLVEVNGIYYRYLIEGNAVLNLKSKYAIIEANGNILTLKEIM
jgi:hypothetical protein